MVATLVTHGGYDDACLLITSQLLHCEPITSKTDRMVLRFALDAAFPPSSVHDAGLDGPYSGIRSVSGIDFA